MTPWIQVALTILTSIIASSGLWAFLGSRIDRDSAEKEMLVGLAHDRIIFLGMTYIDRGWITQDEYENLDKYLYGPYKKLGGNGSADRIMREVDTLEIRKVSIRRNDNNENER